jgi:hypothetical protein
LEGLLIIRRIDRFETKYFNPGPAVFSEPETGLYDAGIIKYQVSFSAQVKRELREAALGDATLLVHQ